ncbi:hypothetical protein BH24ACT5_BH24ACT5_25690 [soil metagenome]
MQVAVEAEVDVFLDRARDERRDDDHPAGPRKRVAAAGRGEDHDGSGRPARSKLRGTDEVFCSQLFGAGVTRTNALEALAISGWALGLSDRDVEAALAEVLGPEAALSKSTVSRIWPRLRSEFDAWKTRDLSRVRLDYLFLDGWHFYNANGIAHAKATVDRVLPTRRRRQRARTHPPCQHCRALEGRSPRVPHHRRRVERPDRSGELAPSRRSERSATATATSTTTDDDCSSAAASNGVPSPPNESKAANRRSLRRVGELVAMTPGGQGDITVASAGTEHCPCCVDVIQEVCSAEDVVVGTTSHLRGRVTIPRSHVAGAQQNLL